LAMEKEQKIKYALENLNSTKALLQTNAERNGKKVPEETLKNVRASTVDPGVRLMKMGDAGFQLAYNVQFATGLKSRVIYGVDVVTGLDPGTPPRLMYQVQNRLKSFGLEISKWICDTAYSSKNDIINAALLFPNCIYFAPPPPSRKDPKKHLKTDCQALKEWKDRIDSDSIKEDYKQRCSTAKFSNMHVKKRALKEFSVRSWVKARGQACLHAIAHNIARFFDLSRR
jgi:hypothetical protein